jgi:hypothetical protein
MIFKMRLFLFIFISGYLPSISIANHIDCKLDSLEGKEKLIFLRDESWNMLFQNTNQAKPYLLLYFKTAVEQQDFSEACFAVGAVATY